MQFFKITFFHKWIGLGEGSNVKQVNYDVHVFLVAGCRCPAVESNRRRGLWSSPVFCLFKRNSKKACIKVSAHWNLTYLHRGRKKNFIFLSREYLIFMWHCITEKIYDENCAFIGFITLFIFSLITQPKVQDIFLTLDMCQSILWKYLK